MAYMSQDKKKELAPRIKAIFKKYGVKGSIGVENRSTLRVKISEGYIDLIGNVIETLEKGFRADDSYESYDYKRCLESIEYIKQKNYFDVNHYNYENAFTGAPRELIRELLAVMNDGNWDKSDIQTDYFNVGWYTSLQIGTWEKPYKYIELIKKS